MDEAAALIYAVMEQLTAAFHEWVRREAPSGAEGVKEVTTLLRQMDSMLARLVLRLGEPHPVSVTFAQHRMACVDVEGTIVTRVFQPPEADQPSLRDV